MGLRSTEFEVIRGLVYAETGILVEPDKSYLVESRLEPLLRARKLTSIGELLDELTRIPKSGLRRSIAQALVNGETMFFRDPGSFDMLCTQLLPRLLSGRAATRRLVIWSAACSTGQEPYSVAMLLDRHFPQLVDWKVRILATDFSEEHLARARAGRYLQHEIQRGLPASELTRWFRRQGEEWELDLALRRRVDFLPLNLVTDFPPAYPVDLVLLRNVMIYWDHATKRSVLERIRSVLSPDGALILGAAETTLQIDDGFERKELAGASYFVARQR
ncbi:MAG: protein-glutamate O-methyltransferase CheR [Myxococcales bacterium]